jgi:acyl-CoA synthetase (AMP-forming)/AMP-acid ligase II
VLTHRALLSNAFMIGERVGIGPRDVGVAWLPLFHDMGLIGALMTSLYWHYPLLLMPAEAFLMHPRRWPQWISRLRATLSVAPNFAYQAVLDRASERHTAGLDLGNWRAAFNGAETVRASTLRAFEQRFGPLGFRASAMLPVYGMAENTLAATFPPRGGSWRSRLLERGPLESRRTAVEARAGGAGTLEVVSVGAPLAGVRLRVLGDGGALLPEGRVGEIALQSPSLMAGYFRNEAQTERAIGSGWLRTGDLGFVHAGELFVTGRVKELIIKRGRNYYPDDIEGVAAEVAGRQLVRAAAFGCPNEGAGTEDVVLLLETRPMEASGRAKLDQAINGALIAALGIRADATVFVAPSTIVRTTSGKIQRAALRARWLQGEIERYAS